MFNECNGVFYFWVGRVSRIVQHKVFKNGRIFTVLINKHELILSINVVFQTIFMSVIELNELGPQLYLRIKFIW